MIIPGIIWAIQKKKSTYVGFHAMQALIWQFIAMVFTLITTGCITIAMVGIPIIMVLSDKSMPARLFPGLMFISIVSMSLLMFGNFAFILYGMIAAVMSYQGKGFRYVMIARYLEKRNYGNGISSPRNNSSE